jgi:hypothetical protein
VECIWLVTKKVCRVLNQARGRQKPEITFQAIRDHLLKATTLERNGTFDMHSALKAARTSRARILLEARGHAFPHFQLIDTQTGEWVHVLAASSFRLGFSRCCYILKAVEIKR